MWYDRECRSSITFFHLAWTLINMVRRNRKNLLYFRNTCLGINDKELIIVTIFYDLIRVKYPEYGK